MALRSQSSSNPEAPILTGWECGSFLPTRDDKGHRLTGNPPLTVRHLRPQRSEEVPGFGRQPLSRNRPQRLLNWETANARQGVASLKRNSRSGICRFPSPDTGRR
ncbi:hypothetical protein GCM10023405_31530 [Streptomonospora salina]